MNHLEPHFDGDGQCLCACNDCMTSLEKVCVCESCPCGVLSHDKGHAVYTLLEEVDVNEGEFSYAEIIGIFSTRKRADQIVTKLEEEGARSTFHVDQWQLDEELREIDWRLQT